ncbi:hypothetical protein [Variovorax sp. J22R115]|uniref:hypothetical protein n=1 Tax=Variovorax sp. J22R115 TaxID=3053509 RepID=UPI002577FE00|nr:hypothetical protein [Variovorax sp. J22R115]MDM0053563.1 hypothetical protein [Variovorax sp. J22R115]
MQSLAAHGRQAFFFVCFMRSLFLAGVLTCGIAAFPALAGPTPNEHQSLFSDWAPYVEIDLWRASDAIPISEFENDWSNGFSPRRGRNVALMRNLAAAGVESNDWRIAYELRQQAAVDSDRETLEVVRMYKQRQPPADSATFHVHAAYTNWSAQGLRVGHFFDFSGIAGSPLRLYVSGAGYTAQPRYRQEEVSGTVSYLSSGSYAFNATQTDFNSRGEFPFMKPINATATGVSVSMAADVLLSDALFLKVKIDDLWSRMRWSNLPVTRRTINSDVSGTDNEGFVNYRPLLSGRNQQVDASFPIMRYGAASLSYRTNAWQYGVQVERFAGVTVPTLYVSRDTGWGVVSFMIETRFQTVGFGFDYGNFHLSLQTDTLNPDRAKAQKVQLSYVWAFL